MIESRGSVSQWRQRGRGRMGSRGGHRRQRESRCPRRRRFMGSRRKTFANEVPASPAGEGPAATNRSAVITPGGKDFPFPGRCRPLHTDHGAVHHNDCQSTEAKAEIEISHHQIAAARQIVGQGEEGRYKRHLNSVDPGVDRHPMPEQPQQGTAKHNDAEYTIRDRAKKAPGRRGKAPIIPLHAMAGRHLSRCTHFMI